MLLYLMQLIVNTKAKPTMNRASFGKLMSKGGQKMKYGKKKPMKSVKKTVKKKKKTMKKKKAY